MKNFGSLLTFIAISASVVSARALPASGDSIEARVPYGVDALIARSPKKAKAAASGAASAAGAASSAAAGKKAKGDAGAAAANATVAAVGAASNSTGAGAAAASGAASGKKAKGGAAAGAGAAKAAPAAAGNAAAGGDLSSIVEGLTGINLGSLKLRSLPVLESRKKNATATATVCNFSLPPKSSSSVCFGNWPRPLIR